MRKPTGIYTRVLTVVIASLMIVISLLIFLVYTGLKGTTNTQLTDRGTEIASYVSTLGSEDILLENDYSLLQLIKKVQASNQNVRYIIVADYKGRILAHTFGTQYPAAMPRQINSFTENRQIKLIKSNEGYIHQVTIPIEDGKIGFVSVGLSASPMQEMLRDIVMNISLAGVIITMLAVFAIGILLAKILEPIRLLAQAAEKIKHNNYSVHVDYRGADEIGTLTRTFNEMGHELYAKDKYSKKLMGQLQEKEHSRDILLHKLFSAQEDERKRISRELHDGVGQSVTSILAYLRILLNNEKSLKQQELIKHTRTIIVTILEELRGMAINLRPPSLDDMDMTSIFRRQVFDTAEQNGLFAEFTADVEIKNIDFSDDIRLALYRILQESMTNIVRHAHAVNVAVSLRLVKDRIVLTITDDGCGFSAQLLRTAREKMHLGLYGMSERVELLDGELKIDSQQNKGTTITASIPIRKKKQDEKD